MITYLSPIVSSDIIYSEITPLCALYYEMNQVTYLYCAKFWYNALRMHTGNTT